VVVAGGDGTIGAVIRKLNGTRHTIGLLPLGTFNNFAHALGIPENLDEAIEVIKHGRRAGVTVGRVNGHAFIEAAALGLFGEAIALGEAAKDLAFGDLRERLLTFTTAKPFRYGISGDVNAAGTALSLVFSNTPTTGAHLPVGDKTPFEPFLDLCVRVGRSRGDLLARALAATLFRWRRPVASEMVLRFKWIAIRTRPRVPVYADNVRVGSTPARIEAVAHAVTVILPHRHRAPASTS
jgi:diacylglycerol kinase family enzyme